MSAAARIHNILMLNHLFRSQFDEVDNSLEVEHVSVQMIKELRQDRVSETWEGLFRGTTRCAIKTPKPNASFDEFLQEAVLVSKLQHPNILQVFGVCTSEEPYYIISELTEYGRLLDYLHGEGKAIRIHKLVDFAKQVATGMVYFVKHNFVHRDLAARNIRLGHNLVCKVTGFSLARQLTEGFYESQKDERFPIKWTSLEAAIYNKYSVKSDVWSFGVLLWEIITLGRIPYSGMTNPEVLEYVQQGNRLPQPNDCPEELYHTMLDCWKDKPVERPTFETLQLLCQLPL